MYKVNMLGILSSIMMISNSVARLVGVEPKTLNHLNKHPTAGEDYKFNMQIEVLDGSTADAMEVWNLEGCFN